MGDGTRKLFGTDAQSGRPGSLYKSSKLFQAAKGVSRCDADEWQGNT